MLSSRSSFCPVAASDFLFFVCFVVFCSQATQRKKAHAHKTLAALAACQIFASRRGIYIFEELLLLLCVCIRLTLDTGRSVSLVLLTQRPPPMLLVKLHFRIFFFWQGGKKGILVYQPRDSLIFAK